MAFLHAAYGGGIYGIKPAALATLE
nr:Unknown Function [uncultured bacterium]